MLNLEIIKTKYGKDCDEKFLKICEIAKTEFKAQKQIFSICDEVAQVVLDLKLDIDSFCAAFLCPLILEDETKIEKFSDFNEVASLLKSILTVQSYSKNYTDPNGLKDMLMAITKDIRVVIIKIAHILVLARYSVHKIDDEQAKYTFKLIDDIYAPFAARLGLSEIKSELQDLSFEFSEPEEYAALKLAVANETRTDKETINNIVLTIKDILKKNNIECTCYGRIKHLSSIYKKIKNKTQSLSNVFDISAARILVGSVSECYTALGIIHSYFTPMDGRFKDYIANPKPNGYKSLHTTVYFNDEFFEIQIRTYEMHEFAEYGIAAHFLYKEHKSSLSGLDNKLLWIRKLLEDKENTTSEMILSELKTDVFLGEIFVQSPKGKVVKLLEDSTPVDFAYAIHSDIGNRCVGARVNGIMVPLISPLKNGDVVEIITSQNSKGPSRDWIKKVKMQSTKEKINYFFKKQMKDENIKLGKTMLEQCSKSNDVILINLLKEEYLKKLLSKGPYSSFDELCAAVGYGSITAEKVIKRLISFKEQDEQKNKTFVDEISKKPVNFDNKSGIVGVQGALTKYCKCCNPIPGDDIIGYVSRGRGVIIHRKDCENVEKLAQSRFIKVDWNTNNVKDFSFESIIEVIAKNQSNIYVEITNALGEQNIKVVSLNTTTNKDGELVLKIGVLVKDKAQLIQVKNKLSSLHSVFEVK